MTKADIVKNISDKTGMDKSDVQMIAGGKNRATDSLDIQTVFLDPLAMHLAPRFSAGFSSSSLRSSILNVSFREEEFQSSRRLSAVNQERIVLTDRKAGNHEGPRRGYRSVAWL